jgi:hypothetical protein
MSERMSNPFVNAEVNAPTQYQEYFRRYSQTTGASSVGEYDRKPFPRMVDFWFLAIAVAVKLGLKPVKLDGVETYKAIEGAAIVSPEWRTHALKLIAIGETQDPEVVKDPRRMMEIANGLAFAGMPRLIEILEESPDDEMFGLSDALVKMIK